MILDQIAWKVQKPTFLPHSNLNSWWGVGLRRGSGAETKGYRISRMSAKPLGKVRNGFCSSANVWLYVSPVMSTGIDPIETSRLTSLSVNKQFEECMVGVWFACTDLRTLGLSTTEWMNMDQLPLKPGASERNLAQLSIMGITHCGDSSTETVHHLVKGWYWSAVCGVKDIKTIRVNKFNSTNVGFK